MRDRVVVAAEADRTVDRLIEALEAEGIHPVRADTVRETLLEFDGDDVVAVLAMASLPDGGGLDLLERVRKTSPDVLTVLLCRPRKTLPINRAQELGIDRTLLLESGEESWVAELVRGALDNRDLVVDRRRERALTGALLAGLSALSTAEDPAYALGILPERLVTARTISVAWTSRYDAETETFDPDVTAGIDRESLRPIPTAELGLDEDGLVRIDERDPRRVTVILRAHERVFGGLHFHVDSPGLAGPERRLLESTARAIGRVLTAPEPTSPADTTTDGRSPIADIEVRGASVRDDGGNGRAHGDSDREAVEVYGEVIAHELRNHLDVAQSYLRLGADVEGNEDLERVDAALSRIESVIKEAEAVAGHAVRDTDKEPVDLDEAAEEVWARIDDQDASLHLENPGTIRANPGLVDLLLENLFRNAITHAGPEVTITVGALSDGFYVEDDGPGIPTAEREAVFDWGYSVRSSRDGVGLAIVRRIAEAHGWAVLITDSASGGARFEFDGGPGE